MQNYFILLSLVLSTLFQNAISSPVPEIEIYKSDVSEEQFTKMLSLVDGEEKNDVHTNGCKKPCIIIPTFKCCGKDKDEDKDD
eukprot:Pgem_evm1s5728